MRPLTWVLKEAGPACLHRHGMKMGSHLTSGPLYLSTPKHNDKSGTDQDDTVIITIGSQKMEIASDST